MKKIYLLFCFFILGGITVLQAQQKSANLSKTQTTSDLSCTKESVAKAIVLDKTVVKKICPRTGKTNYFRVTKCATSGREYLKQVEYCQKTAKFVNYAPRGEGISRPVNARSQVVKN